jgi:hypothetical protein
VGRFDIARLIMPIAYLDRFDVLKERMPRVLNEVVSMPQTSLRLVNNGELDEGMKLFNDAKSVFTDFNNELNEVVAHLTRRKGSRIHGANVDKCMGELEKMRKNIDLLENVLREEVLKARRNERGDEPKSVWARLRGR